MVMMPVMVMMVSVAALAMMDGAIVLVAMLARGFELKCCVGDAVLCELLAYRFLDVMCISLGDNVERCIVVMSIHTPNVNVVNVLYTFDMSEMLANFVDFDAVRRFFEEKVDGFL